MTRFIFAVLMMAVMMAVSIGTLVAVFSLIGLVSYLEVWEWML